MLDIIKVSKNNMLRLCCTCAIVAVLSSANASVAQVAQDEGYVVVATDLQSLLETIASDRGFRLNVASRLSLPALPGVYSGDTDALLTEIALAHGLDYFEYNGVNYFSRQSDTTTRIVPIDDMPADFAIEAMVESGLPVDLFPVRPAANGRMLVMSGPPHYLALSETVMGRLEAPSRGVARNVVVRRGIAVEELD